jgi:hypothetical protein
MKSEQIATLILPFEKLDYLCQVGTNVTKSNSMFIIAAGKKAGSTE